MNRSDNVRIEGDLDTVYRLGSEIERWPEILPHYRSVEILRHEGNRYMARMKANRSGIPVSWVCIQERDPETPEIRFRHIGGFTRGMDVTWSFEEDDDGSVTVTISHDFRKGWPVDRFDRFVSDTIVGDFFVGNIAGKTLSMVKQIAERERGPRRGQHATSRLQAGART